MIVDRIDQLERYIAVLPGLDKAAAFVQDFWRNPRADGRYEIDGERIFANVSTYDTKDRDGAQFESHRKYVDLQAVICGEEAIGWAPLTDALTVTKEEFSKGGDIAYYTGETVIDTVLPAGTFALLLPQDAHMPCLYTGKERKVTKIIVKIAL